MCMKPPRLLPELDDPVVAGGDEEGLLALGVDQAEVRQTVRVLVDKIHLLEGLLALVGNFVGLVAILPHRYREVKVHH